MNISELSIQLRELSDNYSRQRITFDEYRSKRKFLLDEIDETLNYQRYAKIPQNVEETEDSNSVDNGMPEVVSKVFEDDIKNNGAE